MKKKIEEYRELSDRLVGIVVSMSDYHSRGSGFDSRLDHEFFSYLGSGTGSTQPREDINRVAA